MKFEKKKITKGMALAALALFAGVVTLFAFNLPTIFNNVFELGPLTDLSPENGVTNIRNDNNPADGPDWAQRITGGGTSVNTADGLFDSGGFVDATGQRSGDIFGGTAAFVRDDPSAGSLTDRNVYSGGPGDKNSDVVGDWTWTNSNVPAKDDLTNVYVYTKNVTGPSVTLPDGTTTTTHKLLFAGVEREEASGDSHIDIEFFQAGIGVKNADAFGNCTLKQCVFDGSNTNNDLLVNMDFTNGGAFGTLSVRRRNSSATNNYTLQETLSGEGCTSSGDICGFNNGSAIQNGGWTSYDNHANVVTTLGTNTFTEFGLDVTALGFGIPCFATVEAKTRSSQSFTASLKDFALQHFQNCFASVATQLHDGVTVGPTDNADDIQINADCPSPLPTGSQCGRGSINVGQTIHDKIIVTGQTGFTTPTGTVTLKRFGSLNCTDNPNVPTVTETLTLTTILASTSTTAGKAAVESSSFTATTSGSVSYKAHYNGDNNYTSPTPDSSCEALLINRVRSKVTTQILDGLGHDVTNQFVQNGTTIHDVATVTGLDSGVTTDPTGTVTFALYPTADCSGSTFTTQLVSLSIGTPGDRISTASSSTQTPSASAGSFLCYKATYSGDTVYLPPDQPSNIEPICAFTAVPEP